MLGKQGKEKLSCWEMLAGSDLLNIGRSCSRPCIRTGEIKLEIVILQRVFPVVAPSEPFVPATCKVTLSEA